MAHQSEAGSPICHAGRRSIAAMKHSTHENFSRDETVSIGSDRSFGLVMAAGFAVIASLSMWREGRAWPALSTIATVFLVAALLVPAALNPLNRAWTKLGILLHKLLNPVVMGL